MTANDPPADVPIVPGKIIELAPGVRRLTAPNPGMMTGPGTNSYLVGQQQLAVIDPGPHIDGHLRQLAAAGDVRWIIATHTHPDHSPGAGPLAAMTGATLVGLPPPDGLHQDQSFVPQHVPAAGERLHGPDFCLRLLHTPGHASNHICPLHEQYRWLFTGDHIMNGSTVVIDPPDGDMTAYLDSLRDLRQQEISSIAPGHGPLFHNPQAVIDGLIAHRLQREARVLAALRDHDNRTSLELVPHVYPDIDTRLYSLAERSLLAHLLKLEIDGLASCQDGCWQAVKA